MKRMTILSIMLVMLFAAFASAKDVNIALIARNGNHDYLVFDDSGKIIYTFERNSISEIVNYNAKTVVVTKYKGGLKYPNGGYYRYAIYTIGKNGKLTLSTDDAVEIQKNAKKTAITDIQIDKQRIFEENPD